MNITCNFQMTDISEPSYSNVKNILPPLLAVGVEINFEALTPILNKHFMDASGKLTIDLPDPKVVLSGVWFNPQFSTTKTLTDDSFKSSTEMMLWFSSMQFHSDRRAFIKVLHIAINNRLVVGEVYIGTTRFYVFFHNQDKVPTTLIKKEISKGPTNSHYQRNYMRIEIERVTLEYRPYRHHVENGKHIIMF